VELRRRTHARDPWPARLGFLLMVVFGAPLLGAEFGTHVGVHPRVLSYAAIAAIIAITALGGYRIGTRSGIATLVHGGLLLIGIAVVVALPYEANLIRLDSGLTLESYPGVKFSRMLLLSGPTVVAAIMVYPLAHTAAFRDGLRVGAVVLGGIGGLQLLVYRDLLSSGAYSDWSAFADEAAFSTINLSMLFLFALVALQTWATERGGRTAIVTAIVGTVACMFAAFLLAQRTTMALGLAFSFVTLLGVVRRRALQRVLWPAVAISVVLVIVTTFSDGTSAQLDAYSAQATRVESLVSGGDTSAGVRVEMWAYCARGFFAEPLGHGFGSFPEFFRQQFYPHNAIAEAAFELGLLGLVAVIVFLHQTAVVLWRLAWSGETLYLFCLVAGLLWVMKAGDFSALGNWLVWLYLGAGALLRRNA
jgi:hypothetical protein